MPSWPLDDDDLADLQETLAVEVSRSRREASPELGERPLLGGVFVAFARGEAGPGAPGDRAWAAATTWRPVSGPRDAGAALRGTSHQHGPRLAADLHEQVVVHDTVPAEYRAGYLAEREGPILERAVRALADRPDVLMVDATGRRSRRLGNDGGARGDHHAPRLDAIRPYAGPPRRGQAGGT